MEALVPEMGSIPQLTSSWRSWREMYHQAPNDWKEKWGQGVPGERVSAGLRGSTQAVPSSQRFR